jgi:hypothetical protein
LDWEVHNGGPPFHPVTYDLESNDFDDRQICHLPIRVGPNVAFFWHIREKECHIYLKKSHSCEETIRSLPKNTHISAALRFFTAVFFPK